MSDLTEGVAEAPPQARDWVPGALAVLVSLGFFGLLGYVAAFPVPAENKDMVNTILTVAGSGWTMAMAYFFGSSHKPRV